MTQQCFGYKCKNVQEGQTLNNHLSKLGYSSASGSNGADKGQLCLFIDPDDKKMFWFADMHEHIFGVSYLTNLRNVREMVVVSRAVEDLPHYDVGASIDFLLENNPEPVKQLSAILCDTVMNKNNDIFETQYQGHFEITHENVENVRRSMKMMENHPIEITVNLKRAEDSFTYDELHKLDGSDIREVLGHKSRELGCMYISEQALADIEAWVNMQQPRKTQEEWENTPLDELDDIPF